MAKLGSAPSEPTADLVARIEEHFGVPTTTWTKPHTGLMPAQRFAVDFADGRSVFVKAAVDDETEAHLRTDHAVISHLGTNVPEVVAWLDGDDRPVLVLEDLRDAHWPADHVRNVDGRAEPVWWKPSQLDELFAALAALDGVEPPPGLRALADGQRQWWPRLLEDDLGNVASLHVASARWIERVAPALAEAEAELDLRGDSLVHNDVRSDNVCFRDGVPILVDWSDARIGWPRFDLANLAQGLPLEGGPDPASVVPDGGAFAAWRAGEMVHRALHDDVPAWLRRVFVRVATIDLDWAVGALALEPRDGPPWRDV